MPAHGNVIPERSYIIGKSAERRLAPGQVLCRLLALFGHGKMSEPESAMRAKTQIWRSWRGRFLYRSWHHPRLMGDGVSRLICSAAMAIAPIRVPRSAPNQPNTPAFDGRLIYRFFRLEGQKQ
jgi:hypothetical protein